MEKYLNKVMIVDGSYTLHRSLHTPGLQELETTTGIKTGGIFGSLRILQSEIKKFPGFFPIFCFDKGLSKRRTDLYPNYKNNLSRQESDTLRAAGIPQEGDEYLEQYRSQRSILINVLKSLGIPSLLIPGWEGDDLQYLLSKVCKEGVVLSDDKDMIQLVSPTVKVRRSMRDETISWDDSDPYYRHPHYTIVKSIVGDGSDNIPSVAKGVGGKSADKIASIIDESENFEDYRPKLEEYLSNNSGAFCKKIESLLDNWDQFFINYNLINLRLVEPPEGMESMIKDLVIGVVGHNNVMRSYSLLGQLEMNSIYPDQIIFSLAASSASLLL